jgi:hypothetical protein
MTLRSRRGVAKGRAAVTVVFLAAVLVASPVLAARLPSARSQWHVIATVTTKNTNIYDMVALPGGSAWVGGTRSEEAPILYHLIGGHLHAVTLPGPFDAFVGGVSGTSASNVWATIENEPDAARLTSHGWKLVSFAKGTDEILMSGLVTLGPKNTWVFTYDFTTKLASAHHYNGSSWSTTPLPAIVGGSGYQGSLSASSPSNIWALAGTVAGTWITLRYNGHTWKVFPFPANIVQTGYQLEPREILISSASSAWVTIESYKGNTFGPIELAHWNGHSWVKLTRKVQAGYLTGPIASDGHGGLWLGATVPNGTLIGKPFFLDYRAGIWTRYTSPAAADGAIGLSAISVVPGTTSVLGVGMVDEGGMGASKGIAVVKYGS